MLVIAPWNYPFLTAVNTIVPALMAGNAVILKHAAQTLLVGERFQAAFDKAGLPKGLFQNIVLNHAPDRKAARLGQDRPLSTSPARSAAGAPSRRPPPAPS